MIKIADIVLLATTLFAKSLVFGVGNVADTLSFYSTSVDPFAQPASLAAQKPQLHLIWIQGAGVSAPAGQPLAIDYWVPPSLIMPEIINQIDETGITSYLDDASSWRALDFSHGPASLILEAPLDHGKVLKEIEDLMAKIDITVYIVSEDVWKEHQDKLPSVLSVQSDPEALPMQVSRSAGEAREKRDQKQAAVPNSPNCPATRADCIK
ncbi:hypothetical protein HDU91_005326 [Kappamyces sp. JEL0680]|nr:hypothetical protein HDU91_005326 [Kappamyces sp. JEL0680]